MVTQIYTAPIKAYTTGSLGRTPSPGVKAKQDELAFSDEDAQRGETSTLAAIKEQSQRGVIGIQAILTDFHSTMDALGVTPAVRDEVMPYLQVVAHQAQKPQPSAGLIKQNLKVAAESLDQFITGALGQKSSVVREWVDALLLQPIEYRSDSPITVPSASSPGVSLNKDQHAFDSTKTSGVASSDTSVKPLSKADRLRIKDMLQEAKQAAKSQDPQKALEIYQSLLDTLRDGDYPTIEGHAFYRMGRILEKGNQEADAKRCYEQADERLAGTQETRIQAKVQKSLGTLFLKEGDFLKATEGLKKALMLESLDNNEAAQSVTLNLLGQAYFHQGNLSEAKQSFTGALERTQDSNPKVLADTLKHLGMIARQEGQLKQAFTYFKQSLETAQSQNNHQGVRQSLQQIASLYLDTGKPEKALQALQKALAAKS